MWRPLFKDVNLSLPIFGRGVSRMPKVISVLAAYYAFPFCHSVSLLTPCALLSSVCMFYMRLLDFVVPHHSHAQPGDTEWASEEEDEEEGHGHAHGQHHGQETNINVTAALVHVIGGARLINYCTFFSSGARAVHVTELPYVGPVGAISIENSLKADV